MNQPDNLGDFFRENKELLKVYVETKSEIFRLQAIRIFSKSMGLLAWMVIAAFLAFLILIFAGLVLGFWLSDLTQSYVKGFGITTGILVLFFVALAVFREKLFVNPIIKNIIVRAREEVRMRDRDDEE
ncbi:SoxR reducing system RseC family protein [Pseudoflavitalea sp. G-6-1-2]|uniref:hypothetical protein n=1 Tax=Pseudoflavitalea sp. G-6-1-2 TaxID=2728841 RepID=UPI00146D8406|nr:hypothetical protein [Pseudoflavitalea sp. G-6-1-2]NML20138.1 SoxR reducing system RseC family protein [Pseudoflavitalea sp. G-6-1-2]